MTATTADPVELAPRLVELGREAGIVARAIGGVAIWLHSPTARSNPFRRTYGDLDLVVARDGRRRIDDVFAVAGFAADTGFNTLHGRERRCYHGPAGEKVDVFIGEFQMCHMLPLDERLELDDPTIPLAELFLSKAQIFELGSKDARDLLALLLDHEVGSDDRETINADRVAGLCAKDWGLWRTTHRTIGTLRHTAGELLHDPAELQTINLRLDALSIAMDAAPKSMRWRARSRVGDRVAWYELPEDPDR
jgi:hypothetical protein